MTRRRLATTMLVYGALALAAIVWGVLGGYSVVRHPAPWLSELHSATALVLSLGLGLVVATLVIVSTRALVKRAGWAQRLHVDFRNILGPMTSKEIAFFAISSGVAEELFFRGAMQPAFGLVITSLLFGGMHFGPVRRFWPWTVWAIFMGFVFGVVYEATGQLAGVVLAHVLINYENMQFIDSYDPQPRGSATASEPGLVSSRFRSGSQVG